MNKEHWFNLLDEPVSGFLRKEGERLFIEGENGRKFFDDENIWRGYADHWIDKKVLACRLRQNDYESGKPIVLIWPENILGEEKENVSAKKYIEVYYNERLVKYRTSFLGHGAINVCGTVFNFAQKINENEKISPQEYFYRPSLGEFSPGKNGGYDISDPVCPRFDKFGRRFMRTIHILRIEGDWVDVDGLDAFFSQKISVNRSLKNPAREDEYANFSIFSDNCVTPIRDGLSACGFSGVKGIFPRDFFINCAKEFALTAKKNKKTKVFYGIAPQLKVPEAQFSKMTPILNPANYFFKWKYFNRIRKGMTS